MKKIKFFTLSLIFVFTLSSCESITIPTIDDYSYDNIQNQTDLITDNTSIKWGGASALSSDSLTLDEMLIYALEDEYTAYAEYEYILATFDVTTPFSNIIEAESKHINMLLPLFETYDITVPIDDSSQHIIIVDELVDTYKAGIDAEILNIDMYNLFLEYNLPDDVRDVFTKLRDASIKHLDAFERNLANIN